MHLAPGPTLDLPPPPRAVSLIERVRTLIVDDHPMFRLALCEILARQPELVVTAEAASVAEAIVCLERHRFDIAIVDVVLPGPRGCTFVDHVLNTQPDCKVLALSGVDEPSQMAEMLRAGASGFALKSQPVEEIVDAIRCVLGGGRPLPEAFRTRVEQLLHSAAGWPLARLTPREREVFDLLVGGYITESIAAKLVISKGTVETDRLRIMNKLAARSLGDLLQLAVQRDLVR